MRTTATALALAAAVLSVGCGEGRAIFNIDALSFLQPSGKDTVGYNVTGLVAASADSFITPQKVFLPSGFGKSRVDSVQLTGAAIIENTSGTGSIRVRIHFAKDSASVYTSTPYIDVSGTVSGPQPSTVTLLPPTVVSLSDTIFNTNQLWAGLHVRVSTNAGPNVVGRVRLTQLLLRVVLQDKIF